MAERSLIGAMLISQGAALVGIENCLADDFYVPFNARAFAAISQLVSTGSNIDPVTVSAEMGDSGAMNELMKMSLDVPSSNNAIQYAELVVKSSSSRKLLRHFDDSLRSVSNGSDPYEIANETEKFVSMLGTVKSSEPESMTINELSSMADDIAPVVIPGLMHQDYRTIVVAEEGAGKSLMLRTIAMAASQGFHPFSHQRIKPIRALVIDLENPAQAIKQTAEPFARHLRMSDVDGYDDERFRIWRKPGGIEIRRLSDRAELQREIAFHRPDLVCIGPIYKMYRRGNNESYEDSADEAMSVLDALRTKYGFALILEHHAAKGRAGEKRDLTPMGSQRWMAWPEIGISLYKDSEDPTVLNVQRYRGDRLTGVDWPTTIVRDKTWLLDGVWRPADY
jgi:hypothetical protein